MTFFVLVAVLPLLAGGIWTAVSVKNHLFMNIHTQNNMLAHELSDGTDQLIRDRVNLVKTLAHMPQVIKMDPAELKPLLKSIKEQNPDVDAVGIMNSTGTQIARSDDTKLLDLKDRSYYKDVVAGRDFAVSEVLISKSSQKPICVVAAPIKENGGIKGVIHLSLTLDSLGELIESTRAGESGYSFITDGKGRVITHPDKQYIVEQKDLSSLTPVQLGMEVKTGFATFSDEGKTWLASYAQTPYLGWIAVTQQDQNEALAEANSMVRNTLVVLFLGALFAALAGVLLSNKVVKPIASLNDDVLSMADGDLTRLVHIKSTDEIGQLARSVGIMRDNLKQMVAQLMDTGNTLSDSANQLASQAQQTSAGATETAATLSQVVASVDQVSDSARVSATVSSEAEKEAQNGSLSVDRLVETMNSITSTTGEASRNINSLSETLKHINQIVGLITTISDQTNLLALNAAIEAARAGDQGRGFAVVAEEVRKLAEQSSGAAKEIGQMIGEVQSKSTLAVTAMAAGDSQVMEGAVVVEEVGRNFKTIIASVGVLADQIKGLSQAADQVSDGVQNMAGTTQQQTAAMEEVAAATEHLARTSADLNTLAKRFKIQ